MLFWTWAIGALVTACVTAVDWANDPDPGSHLSEFLFAIGSAVLWPFYWALVWYEFAGRKR